MKEEWKDIEGYEGYYQVSNLGRVRSLGRSFTNIKGYTHTLKGKVLSQSKEGSGYLQVQLWRDNKGKPHKVHRLVATAFLNNPEDKEHVNHIDGNKENNCVSNLEWSTISENNLHAYIIGLRTPRSRCGFIINPFGQLVYYSNVSHFCYLNSLDRRDLYKLFSKDKDNLKGWRLLDE